MARILNKRFLTSNETIFVVSIPLTEQAHIPVKYLRVYELHGYRSPETHLGFFKIFHSTPIETLFMNLH